MWSSILGLSLVLGVVFLFNSGIPPAIGFFAEVLGLSSVFVTISSFCLFIGYYYFISLVYSVLLVSSMLRGSSGARAKVFLWVGVPFLVLACASSCLF